MSGSVSRNVKLLKNQDKPFSTIVKYGPDMLHTQEVTDSSSVVSTTAVQIHVICTVFSFLRTLWSGLLLPFFSDQTVTHTGVWSGTDRAENRDIDGPQPKNICTITEKSVI